MPSTKPVRSRSRWYTQPIISEATVANGARVSTTAMAASDTTSRSPPAIHTATSCWVAGMVKPSGPTTGASRPWTPSGIAWGVRSAHSSGRNPTVTVQPDPIVVISPAGPSASTTWRSVAPARRSNWR